MNIETLLTYFDGVKKSTSGYQARCPAHDDKTPSLSITEKDGKILINCFNGCTNVNGRSSPLPVLEKIGLKLTDLYTTNGHGRVQNIIATYHYRDASGNMLYRKHKTSGTPPYWFERYEHGQWINKLTDNTPRVLYRLPELMEGIKAGKIVYFPEGEKDVQTLAGHNLIATTNYDGANGKWHDEYSSILAGASVVLLPDHDKVGYKRVERFAKALKPIAASVKIIKLDVKEEKEDITDWFMKYGHTVDDLEYLVKSTAEWEPTETEVLQYSESRNVTDTGNAQRIIDKYGDVIRFCYTWKSWIIWNGKYWQSDNTGKIIEYAQETVKSIYTEAEKSGDETERKRIARHAMSSEGEHKIKAMISLARSKVPVQPEDFDTNKFLLNVRNGTVELNTGNLREHKQGDTITKHIDIDYDDDATCPEWRKFLFKIFHGNIELCNYIQRAVGYSLTGITDERVLFILHGGGRNGKTTFVETIARLLNDYATRTQSETLLMKKHEGVPSDIARLRGARFVYASETSENRRLAESRIKDLTGGDKIAARFLFQDYFEFIPEFKLWLSTNHRPRVRDTSRAIWDRIRLIPFDVTIQDQELKPRREIDAVFTKEMSGILRWAVEGCLMWQREGLGLPDAVKTATSEYHDEEDQVKAFIDEKCITGEDAKVDNTLLWKAYNTHCDENNEHPVSRRAFKQNMEGRGFVQKHSGRKFWEGLGLLHE